MKAHQLLSLACIAFLLSACSGEAMTPIPSPTALPPYSPPAVVPWNNMIIRSICLQMRTTYAQLPNPVEPLDLGISTVLQNMGIEVLPAEGNCDATMTAELNFGADLRTYESVGSCYSVGGGSGTIRLMSPGKKDIQVPVESHYSFELPGGMAIGTGYCQDHRKAESFDFTVLWSTPIMQAFYRIWGLSGAIWASTAGYGYDESYFNSILPSEGLTNEMLTTLEHALRTPSPKSREAATVMLLRAGSNGDVRAIAILAAMFKDLPEQTRFEVATRFGYFAEFDAEKTIPVLIECLEDPTLVDIREACEAGLMDFSGWEPDDKSPNVWKKWWKDWKRRH